jgi:hypothetical protein
MWFIADFYIVPLDLGTVTDDVMASLMRSK